MLWKVLILEELDEKFEIFCRSELASTPTGANSQVTLVLMLLHNKIHTHIYAYTRICIYTYIQTNTYIHIHTYTPKYIYTYIHKYMLHNRIHTHIHREFLQQQERAECGTTFTNPYVIDFYWQQYQYTICFATNHILSHVCPIPLNATTFLQ